MVSKEHRGHIIADLAFNHVEKIVLRCGYTMHRVVQDYGLDAIIRTFSPKGIMESGVIWVQLKASDSIKPLKRTGSIGMRAERRDLLSWMGELYPVILVLYDAKADAARWLHVQEELGEGRIFSIARGGATTRLYMQPDQIVTEETVRNWRESKNRLVETW